MNTSNIHGGVQLFGILGDPIFQSRASALVNILLAERGLDQDNLMVPLHVSSRGLGATIQGLRHIRNFAGALITMPHKRPVLSYLDVLSPDAQLIGAVNIVRRMPDGRLEGDILDGQGFVTGLRQAGHSVQGKTCLLVGAGGAAAAIACALATHGCARLVIINRTERAAQDIANLVHNRWPQLPVTTQITRGERFDIAINATPLGMKSTDPLPMSSELVSSCTLVADCIIAPETTPLLALAQQHQCVVHHGAPMFAGQMGNVLKFWGL